MTLSHGTRARERLRARHVRPEGARGGHPSGVPRPAHRSRQPRALHRPRRGGARPAWRLEHRDRRRPVARPRRLQDRQRQPRARCRRRAARRASRRGSGRACAPATRSRASRGDEFAILLDDLDDERAAVAVAKRVGSRLEAPFEIDEMEIAARASIGISLGQTPDARPEDLLRDADVAMYAAKAGGKGGFQVFEPHMRHAVVKRMELKARSAACARARRAPRPLPAVREARGRVDRGCGGSPALGACGARG